jgi:hypothetical protein
MKWVFLISDMPFLVEFFAKLSDEITKRGDECLVIFNAKITEYGRKNLFNKNIKFISRVDWCFKNYQSDKKEFGGLSWKDFFPIFDRYGMLDFNYDNSLKIVSQNYQFFEFIFNEEKPDVVVSESPAGLFHQVARYFCKKNNVSYLGLNGSRFDNRIDVYDFESTYSKYEEIYKRLAEEKLTKKEEDFSKDFIKKFVSHEKLPPYMDFVKVNFSQVGLLKHYISRIKNLGILLLRCFWTKNRYKGFDYETEIILKHSIRAPFWAERKQFRIFSQRKIFNDFNNDKKYFLFPLHLQPEASTSVFATYYNDQLSTIKNISFSVPFPYKLYVKEHPAAIGSRPKSFYKKLKKIPNIVLLSPNENTENLIKNSSGVITLTSTVGMEAALAGKMVYVLGDAFYSYHPLCRKLKNFEELKNRIEADLISKQGIYNLEDINNRFIMSCFNGTIEGSVTSSSVADDTNNYESIYNHLKKILEGLNYGKP